MNSADFDFSLPSELIAQHPAARRDESRLLVLDRKNGNLRHRQFRNFLEYLRPGDVLILNNSRVIPARLRGQNVKSGGAFEMLLLEEIAGNNWWALLKPGKRAQIGTQIRLRPHNIDNAGPIVATVAEINTEGHRRLEFSGTPNIASELDQLGEIPLPPYIARKEPHPTDRERYQTVFARQPGSVAAPTAGLHFTEKLLDEIRAHGVHVHFVTLHVGLGTFAPVKATTLAEHIMHEERYEIDPATASAVNAAKRESRRVIAIGTTSVRVLESAATDDGKIPAHQGRTRIFIHPPHNFKIVDALLTNFHLPRSTLVMLVSAFATPGATQGREMILSAYAEAIRERYRFFSYGDAMLLV